MNHEAPHSSSEAPAPSGGMRTMLPAVALAFVALCVLALAVTPLAMTQRLTALRERSAETTDRARSLLAQLRLLLADQLISHILSDTGEPEAEPPFEAYREYRAEELRIAAQLDTVSALIDGRALLEWRTLRSALAQWHTLSDARASGELGHSAFVSKLKETAILRDSVLVSYARLDSAVAEAEAMNRAAGASAVAMQRRASYGLGACAAVALVLLAWFGERERRLALALSHAVAEQTRLRAESERRREDLARISDSKDRLVRGFTHDVKNPIGAADGYLQLVEDGITGPITERQKTSIARARRAIRSALALIGDLLEVAQAEAGHLTIDEVAVDLRTVALDVTEEFRAQAEAKGLGLAFEGEEVPSVRSDPARVRQVIGNLVSNAVKYTPAGAVTVRAFARSVRRAGHVDDAGDDGMHVVVEVCDTGPGIPREKRRLLFQEFSRLDPSAAPGIGLGLAMSRRIAEALGGELTVESEVGRGSNFALVLPLTPAPRTARERDGAREGATARATAGA